MDTRSPRSSHDTLVVARSPSRHRSRSRRLSGSRHWREISETDIVKTVRPRSTSRHSSSHSRHHRRSSPARIIERRDDSPESSDKVRTGPLAIIPRRDSDNDIREIVREGEPRYGGIELTRDTEITTSNGEREEIVERRDRRGRLSLVRRKRHRY